jgi:hypothetical protein
MGLGAVMGMGRGRSPTEDESELGTPAGLRTTAGAHADPVVTTGEASGVGMRTSTFIIVAAYRQVGGKTARPEKGRLDAIGF